MSDEVKAACKRLRAHQWTDVPDLLERLKLRLDGALASERELAKQNDAWNRRADGWTPVEDRLPEERGYFLCHWAGARLEFDAHAVLFYEGGDGGWHDAEGIYYNPTHWQPLPDPPAEVTPEGASRSERVK